MGSPSTEGQKFKLCPHRCARNKGHSTKSTSATDRSIDGIVLAIEAVLLAGQPIDDLHKQWELESRSADRPPTEKVCTPERSIVRPLQIDQRSGSTTAKLCYQPLNRRSRRAIEIRGTINRLITQRENTWTGKASRATFRDCLMVGECNPASQTLLPAIQSTISTSIKNLSDDQSIDHPRRKYLDREGQSCNLSRLSNDRRMQRSN
ncbi:hypothetical protein Bca4012_065315 [Brassica carinata]